MPKYGLLRLFECISEDTPVITTVHDCQIVTEKDIPREKLLPHDLCVDVIVTPTRVGSSLKSY